MRAAYSYGNVVRKTDVSQKRRNDLRAVEGGNIKRNTQSTTGITAGYVFFLAVMLCVVGYFCMSYLNLTSTITNDLTKIAKLEAEYNSLKAENDDYENRINGAVDLERIKKVAMNDLGMQYAEDNQIVYYESDDTDYVRQYIALE